jgi:hypothetical protein
MASPGSCAAQFRAAHFEQKERDWLEPLLREELPQPQAVIENRQVWIISGERGAASFPTPLAVNETMSRIGKDN